MNHLIAQIRTRQREKRFKLFSLEETVFDIDTLNLTAVEYDVDHNLDEDCWFKIEQFSEKEYCLDFLRRDFVAAEYNDLARGNFEKIAYICSIQNHDVHFQKVSKSTYLNKKCVVHLGDATELEQSKTRLYINQVPDAIYLKQSDTLVFRKLATISSIFPGIDTLYKEATNEEVQQFLNNDFLELSDDFGLDKVSKPNRARIAMAMDTLAEMDPAERDNMLTYIHTYCEQELEFNQATNQFKVDTDDQLKMLLYGIEERFYTTPRGNEKRLANSIRTL